jgi:methyl-accepting chemotaxis protein
LTLSLITYPRKDETGKVVQTTNTMLHSFKTSVVILSSVSTSLDSTAQELAAAAEELNSSNEEMSSAIQEISQSTQS